ncbi:MAG: hypothetical protein BWZ02_01484 [Lentisphaerae bacterium ADurb.BinA184]|nr:MAG: hypothetical protein BWZ02_01484 [Lentisphaerae bacterium ADurb.BinA184]
MKQNSLGVFGAAVAVAAMVWAGAALGGTPWYWDGSTNEWDADYVASPLNNHWLESFGGAMNANMPSGNWNSLYVRDGKVSFSDATYLGTSGAWTPQNGVMGTTPVLSGGELEWNNGICDSVGAPTVGGSYSAPATIMLTAGLFGSWANSTGVTINTDGIFTQQGGILTKLVKVYGGATLAPTRAVANLAGGTGPGAIMDHGVIYQTGGAIADVVNPSFGGIRGNFSTIANITIGTRQHHNSTQAYYYLGDAAGNTGTIGGTGTLIVGGKANWGDVATLPPTVMKAELRGHGTVTIAGLDNNRSVIADGYGANRTLDLSGVTTISNTYLNGVTPYIANDAFRSADGTDGWYAVNRGKLLFPPAVVTGGTSSVNVGESAADTQVDLINSVKLAFTDVTGGPLSVSLLAPDRTDLGKNAFDATTLSLHDVDTAGGFDFGGGSAVLTFRYDDVLATSKGIAEASLKVWQLVGRTWLDVTGSVDTANNLITTTGLSSFSMFGIGPISPTYIPEPASAVALGLAGLLALRRRR